MKNVFESMMKWFSSTNKKDIGARDVPTVAVLEFERRLRELEKSGRKLFLP